MNRVQLEGVNTYRYLGGCEHHIYVPETHSLPTWQLHGRHRHQNCDSHSANRQAAWDLMVYCRVHYVQILLMIVLVDVHSAHRYGQNNPEKCERKLLSSSYRDHVVGSTALVSCRVPPPVPPSLTTVPTDQHN